MHPPQGSPGGAAQLLRREAAITCRLLAVHESAGGPLNDQRRGITLKLCWPGSRWVISTSLPRRAPWSMAWARNPVSAHALVTGGGGDVREEVDAAELSQTPDDRPDDAAALTGAARPARRRQEGGRRPWPRLPRTGAEDRSRRDVQSAAIRSAAGTWQRTWPKPAPVLIGPYSRRTTIRTWRVRKWGTRTKSRYVLPFPRTGGCPRGQKSPPRTGGRTCLSAGTVRSTCLRHR